jgi:hypothetical protein
MDDQHNRKRMERPMTQLYNAGLYVTQADELYAPGFGTICAHVNYWVNSDYAKEEVAKFHSGTRDGGLKSFVIKYATPDQNGVRHYHKVDPLLSLLNPKVQSIVESAIGPARCICVDLWHNPAGCNQKEKVWSQSWHRDPEDPNVCKVFVYFSEVSEDSGPFEYVLCSHLNWWDLCPPCRYPPETIDDSVIPSRLFAKVTGGPGTVAFCQTSGLHRGGHGEKARTMAVLSFVPEQSQARTLFMVDQ